MKYREIFKKWYFWGAIAGYSLIEIIKYRSTFREILITQYAGIFLGSFIVIWIIASFIFVIHNFVGRRKNLG